MKRHPKSDFCHTFPKNYALKNHLRTHVVQTIVFGYHTLVSHIQFTSLAWLKLLYIKQLHRIKRIWQTSIEAVKIVTEQHKSSRKKTTKITWIKGLLTNQHIYTYTMYMEERNPHRKFTFSKDIAYVLYSKSFQ